MIQSKDIAMQNIIELAIIAIMFIISLIFIYKKYFTKKSSPCGGCTACDKGDIKASDKSLSAPCNSHSSTVQVFFRG